MAIYSKGTVVFGVGILVVVSFCCMKTIEADDGIEKIDDPGVTLHAISREDPPVGCNSPSDASEECTSEDDKLGLYSDVDDTFKAVKHVAVDDDDNDSPDILHNNVDVLGH
ncbi:hypothetical protein Lal_00048692 [Lupinus albus]|uniref:Uncharacterized protein n=1 Tax=Lupinus albus TaxID=3870 RepID=A0A6A5LT03_LUPAL|nr:hypothetical protein Lalb_Chr17g0347131 [Lupinus albus]KAF1864127.1 hypothetical protein Lal_00048692 [Lupinus albus]